MNLYLTADEIGLETGGGIVTLHESGALRRVSDSLRILERPSFPEGGDPWGWDEAAYDRIFHYRDLPDHYDLAHIYSGSFPKTVAALKEEGTKISYTIAAHDKEISRREHEKFGLPFPYTHLTDPALWRQYIEGYRLADVIICPGTVPRNTVQKYGPEFADKRIEIIPHGCNLPEAISPIPPRFVVGYMGALGPDKGVRYLLEAWKKLDYRDGSYLAIAGKDSLSPWALEFYKAFGGGNICPIGWVKNTTMFYEGISVYCQPSATEGFGIEVVEAMAHGRPVICSDGAGAVDLIRENMGTGDIVTACDAADLAESIHSYKSDHSGMMVQTVGDRAREAAAMYTWDKVRQQYIDLWRSL